jgi:TolB-like protein/Tfp pilus assembly protein PilF
VPGGEGDERTADAAGVTRAVFISYASQDAAATARICTALRQAGIDVWFDQSELRGGDAWDQRIRREIRDCTLFMPVISANTASRHEGYFRLEWDLADKRTHMIARDRVFIVPVCLDTTADSGTDVPESFHRVQWTRLPGDETPPEFVARIARLLSPQPQPTVGVRQSAELAPDMARRPLVAERPVSLRRSLSVIVAALVTVAVAWLLIDRPWSRGHGLSAAPPTTGGIAAAPSVTTSAALTSATFSPPPHSVAVLPFVNMSGDATQDYFSDGITEELLDSLSRLNELQVVARTSSFSFKGQNADISSIARKLNVGAILEGSVRRAGNTVRITVQLINGASGFHIWSQTYDRDLSDILKVQTDVATEVAKQLEVKLVGDEADKIEEGGTKNPEAYDAYLRGIQMLLSSQVKEANTRAALASIDQAIALDHDYALAYVGRTRALTNILIFMTKPDERAALRLQILQSAERAVALAPEMGEAHMALAATRAYCQLDFTRAAPEYVRALVLAPGSAWVQRMFAAFSSELGHHEMALKAARRAVSLDPQSVNAHITLGHVFARRRHYDEAVAAYQHAFVLSLGSHPIEADISDALLASGQAEQARQLCELPATPLDDDERDKCLALAYHALGRQADADRRLEQLTALDGDRWAFEIAEIYAQWGKTALALHWLTKAQQLGDPSFQILKVDWALDPIRNEPQFKAIEAWMNFPP